MTILHRTSEQDFDGLAEEANNTEDVFVLLTGVKFTQQQFMEVSKFKSGIRWMITKRPYDEAVKEVREKYGK